MLARWLGPAAMLLVAGSDDASRLTWRTMGSLHAFLPMDAESLQTPQDYVCLVPPIPSLLFHLLYDTKCAS